MRILKIMLIILVLGSIGVMCLSCASESNTASVPQDQTVSVQRGNLILDIAASGNLVFSLEDDLAFEMAGYVAEILVKEGDSVKQGQVLARLDTSEWEENLMSLESSVLSAEISLKNAQYALEQDLESNATATGVVVAVDPLQIEIDELQVKVAQARLVQAQKALVEAQNTSPEIIASFDGFIAKVNISGGDEVYKGTVAVTLADPDKFEVDILVSEMDISQVTVGGAATVEADAVSGVIFPAEVTHISPTATIQSGVVNYSVTVEVESLETVAQQGQTSSSGQGSATSTSQANQLREGMTITVNIVVAQRTGVLLVPNDVITTWQGQSYVQVVSSTGAIERRAIKTGVTDYVNTEVTEGLNEGEKVVVTQGTIIPATSTTDQQNGPPGGIMIPGMGEPPQ